jgi:hypothetical protein
MGKISSVDINRNWINREEEARHGIHSPPSFKRQELKYGGRVM